MKDVFVETEGIQKICLLQGIREDIWFGQSTALDKSKLNERLAGA